MKCVNLKKQFGREYKVVCEESYHSEYGANARTEDPWLMVVLCQNGHICPWGGSMLAACTDKNGSIANLLRKNPLVNVVHDGDDGVNAVFNMKHFDEIANIMKPRKRRRLSEAQKQKSVDRLRKYWPSKGQSVPEAARQQSKSARECDQAGLGDPEAVQGQNDAKSTVISGLTSSVNLGSLPDGEVAAL